jgi:hypothetical protein
VIAIENVVVTAELPVKYTFENVLSSLPTPGFSERTWLHGHAKFTKNELISFLVDACGRGDDWT